MKTDDVIDHFGSQAEIARTLRISEATVSRWPEIVPFKWALRIENVTERQLSINLNDYRKSK